jgi:hypothetical protein
MYRKHVNTRSNWFVSIIVVYKHMVDLGWHAEWLQHYFGTTLLKGCPPLGYTMSQIISRRWIIHWHYLITILGAWDLYNQTRWLNRCVRVIPRSHLGRDAYNPAWFTLSWLSQSHHNNSRIRPWKYVTTTSFQSFPIHYSPINQLFDAGSIMNLGSALPACFMPVSCLGYSSSLKIEAIFYSETSECTALYPRTENSSELAL